LKAILQPMEQAMTRIPMRYTMLTAAILCLGGTSASFAQLAPGVGLPGAPVTGTPTLPGVSATRPRPGTVTLTPLGGISLNLATQATPAQTGVLGTIAACPAAGIATSPTSAPSTAALQAANGIIPTAPAGSAPVFGNLTMSGACNPIVPGSTPATTAPPDPNVVANFANGALPLNALETGSGGMSPTIVVPSPTVSSPGTVTSSAPALNTGENPLAFIDSGPTTSQIPVFPTPSLPAPAISSSGCAGIPSCGGSP
jgi:hypothetical protein